MYIIGIYFCTTMIYWHYRPRQSLRRLSYPSLHGNFVVSNPDVLQNPVTSACWPLARIFLSVGLAVGLFISPAYAQNGERQRTVAGAAGDAVTQPLEDLNLKSRKIPTVLSLAQHAPYGMEGLQQCLSLQIAIQELDRVLGPDADEVADEAGVARTALDAGGNFLGGFIPFRGVVRTLSGANQKRAEMLAAIYAGVARRSYLKGYSAAKSCSKTEEIPALTAIIPASDTAENLPAPFLTIVPGAASPAERSEKMPGSMPVNTVNEPIK